MNSYSYLRYLNILMYIVSMTVRLNKTLDLNYSMTNLNELTLNEWSDWEEGMIAHQLNCSLMLAFLKGLMDLMIYHDLSTLLHSSLNTCYPILK
jgi:hypothetical protein